MVHLPGVHQFVQHHILHQLLRQQQCVAGEVDALPSRTTAPAPFAVAYTAFLIRQMYPLGECPQAGQECHLRLMHQYAHHHLLQPLLHPRLREVGVRRADQHGLTLLLPEGELSAHPLLQREVQQRCLDTEVPVDDAVREELCPLLCQRSTELLERLCHRLFRAIRRKGDQHPATVGTQDDMLGTCIDAIMNEPQLRVGIGNKSHFKKKSWVVCAPHRTIRHAACSLGTYALQDISQ